MITPKGPIPIAIDGTLTIVLGAIAIALGGAAFIVGHNAAATQA